VILRAAARAAPRRLWSRRGEDGEDGEDGEYDDEYDAPKPPRTPWSNHEKERLRRGLLFHGLGRWEKIRDALKKTSRAKHPTNDVAATCWDLLRALRANLKPGGKESTYVSTRLRGAPEKPGGSREDDDGPDELVGPWSKVKTLARSWARRLELLDGVNRAAERAVAEETQDDALALLDSRDFPRGDKLPAFWNATCDLYLLHGIATHGFGAWEAIRADPECFAAFAHAARESGGDAALEELTKSCERIDARAAAIASKMKGMHGGKDPTIAHAEDCECFVCKRRRAKRDATKTTTAAEKADDDDDDDDDDEDDDEDEDQEEEEEEEEVHEEEDEDEDEDDDGNEENEETDNDESAAVNTPRGDGTKSKSKEEAKADREAAREAARLQRIANKKTHKDIKRANVTPNSWPLAEVLTHRVKQLAKGLGARDVLAPSDPPWVAAYLGRKRKRAPRDRNLPLHAFGGGEDDDAREKAKRRAERRERKRARAKRRSARNAQVAEAMDRGDWAVVADDSERTTTRPSPSPAAAGDDDDDDDAMDVGGGAKRPRPLKKKEKQELVKTLMSHGLCRVRGGGADWARILELSGLRGHTEADVAAAFNEIATEMDALASATKGILNLKKRLPGKIHKENCGCIVCKMRRRKEAEGGGGGGDDGAEGGGGGGSQDAEPTTPGSVATSQGDDDDDEFGDDDDDDDDDTDGGTGGGTGASTPAQGGGATHHDDTLQAKEELEKILDLHKSKKGRVLTATNASRLNDRLNLMQTLRNACDAVGGNLASLRLPPVRTGDIPVWWTTGVHDIGLVAAALKYGLSDWDAAREDPDLPFRDLGKDDGGDGGGGGDDAVAMDADGDAERAEKTTPTAAPRLNAPKKRPTTKALPAPRVLVRVLKVYANALRRKPWKPGSTPGTTREREGPSPKRRRGAAACPDGSPTPMEEGGE
jgi:hypothetical protein